jgi:hypothetical protein
MVTAKEWRKIVNRTLIKAALPVLDLRTAAWNTVQALRLTVQIEVTVTR